MPQRLTPTMRMALNAIEALQGLPALDYPGGARTIAALMRRGRVEVQGKDWLTFLPEHEHRFMRTMHIDGCHYFGDSGRCECGVSYQSHIERNVASDPYSAVWMEPAEDGPCERCIELLAGARPHVSVVIARVGNGR